MCMIDSADGMVTVLSTRRPKARTPHRCGECRRTIHPGERYLSEATVFDGEFDIHRTCAHCCVARDWMLAECSGFVYGSIEEDIREHCHDGMYPMAVYRLAAGMTMGWHGPRRLLPVPKPPTTTHDKAKRGLAEPPK